MSAQSLTNKHLPFQSHFVTVGGSRLHYLDEGSGPVVLLLHGNPTWCFYYRHLIGTLKDHFRVIAPDYIGMGLSEHPSDAHFRAADRIEHLTELVKVLDLEKVSLVMHDWGGPIGTGFAVRNPERIEKLVYLNTTLTETEALPTIIKMAATPGIGKLLTKYTKRFLKLTTNVGVSRKLPKEIKEGYYFPYRSADRRTAIWDFVDDIPFDSSHPSYVEMMRMAEGLSLLREVPVQIIWGLKDICFHREMLNKVAAHFPQAQILEIPDASHLVLEDAPELANKTILDFMLGETADAEDQARDQSEAFEKQNALYRSLIEVSQQMPHAAAVIEPLFLVDSVRYRHVSFAEFSDRLNKYQRGLSELGLRAGDKVLMLVPAGFEFLALSYAVMGRGAIPIFIDPGIGREHLFRCIQDIAPDVLIGSLKAQLLRLKGKQLFPNLKFHVTASDWFLPGRPNLAYLKRFSSKPLPPVATQDTAFVAFTSGATGVPKGVVFTNEMLRAQLEIFREDVKLEPQKKDLPLLPIFSLFHSAAGICSVFAPIDSARPLSLAPERVVKIITDLQIQYSFGSPTLWNKIAEYCIRSGTTLSSLEKILVAGAPVSEKTLERVRKILGPGEVYTPYGATEALPVTLVSSQQVLNNEPLRASDGEFGTFVGRAVSKMRIRVVKPLALESVSAAELEDLPVGEIGEVIVQGSNVSPQYLLRPEATEAAKIQDGAQFWHRMGDMGYLDTSANLYFCGRRAHLVQSSARTFYSVPTERIFNEHPKVKRSALIRLSDGDEPGIVIEPHPHSWPATLEKRGEFISELRELAASSEVTTAIRHFFFHPSFPVDSRHNAKIFREELSNWAQRLEQYENAA